MSEDFKCAECGNTSFEYKNFSNKYVLVCDQCKSESYEKEESQGVEDE